MIESPTVDGRFVWSQHIDFNSTSFDFSFDVPVGTGVIVNNFFFGAPEEKVTVTDDTAPRDVDAFLNDYGLTTDTFNDLYNQWANDPNVDWVV